MKRLHRILLLASSVATEEGVFVADSVTVRRQ